MNDELYIKSGKPLMVNEAFLRALDTLMNEITPVLISEAAQANEITEVQLKKFLQGNKRGLSEKFAV
ncbi:hypothetical protein [Altererythrobacter sp. GH1-8]|uniref:hypothetical protein n=1 Tax=Altererythrobacter sp. GH1-8 TaxID=3349333 RepID=UPI00374D0C85